MRFLQRLPLDTRRRALVVVGVFAVVAGIGAANLSGQTSSLCGNGIKNAGEECDESTRNGIGPNCTYNCTLVECGDGIISRSVGEECDAGSGSTMSSQPSCGRICGDTCKWKIVSCAASSVSSAASVPSSKRSSVSSVPKASSSSSSSAVSESAAPSPSSVSSVSIAVSSKPAAASSVVPPPASSVAPPKPVSSAAPSAPPVASSARPPVASAAASSAPAPQPVSSAPPPAVSSAPLYAGTCGDGWITAREACDDGNILDGDGCSRICVVTPVLLPHCGDGSVQDGEECDDGSMNANRTPNACRTNCRLAYCGDGVTDATEACDDGNADERDGCTWRCEISVCGNGLIEAMEECDVGAGNSDATPNTCRSVCRKPWCGDGVADAGEECDDANADETDSCMSTCQLRCPKGSNKIQGRCVVLSEEDDCGAMCMLAGGWDSFVTWLFGLIS